MTEAMKRCNIPLVQCVPGNAELDTQLRHLAELDIVRPPAW